MIKKIFYILIVTLYLTSNLYAAGSSGSSSSSSDFKTSYEKAVSFIKDAKKLEKKGNTKKAEKKYKKALKLLLKSNKEKPNNPDTLNYLGFTSRKLGDFTSGEKYYLQGLKINPKHIGINEYLGELYVATNRIDQAKERLEVLKNCNCKEYSDLKDIIAGTKTSKY
tara:strand:- start:14 stop:511 length:498 start_codon:yes stop_codon:yes gene_type:complete